MPSASAGASLTGTSSPVSPSRTTSRQPRIAVATHGTPMAAASMGDRGMPSRCDGSTQTFMSAYSSGMSCRYPVNTVTSPIPYASAVAGLDRVASVPNRPVRSSAGGRGGTGVLSRPNGVEQFEYSLFHHQPADEADDLIIRAPVRARGASPRDGLDPPRRGRSGARQCRCRCVQSCRGAQMPSWTAVSMSSRFCDSSACDSRASARSSSTHALSSIAAYCRESKTRAPCSRRSGRRRASRPAARTSPLSPGGCARW